MMTALRCGTVLFLIVAGCCTERPKAASSTSTTPAPANDLAQLQGEWAMVSGTADGFEMPAAMLPNMKRVCRGNELTVMNGDQLIMKSLIALDPTKSPKTIDYQVIDGPTKGKTQLGIYELDGGTLRSCFAAPDAPRPTDFTSPAGERRTASVWKKVK